MDKTVVIRRVTALVILILTSGCESRDARLAEFAQRVAAQQDRQNDQIAEQSRAVVRQSNELTSAANKLVEQDAIARRELIQAQDKIQSQVQGERSSLDRQREQLDAERRSVAATAVREPLIANAIVTLGWILAVLLPLLVTAYALRKLPDPEPIDELLTEVVIEDLASGGTGLLPDDRPPVLGPAAASLPGPPSQSDSEGDPTDV